MRTRLRSTVLALLLAALLISPAAAETLRVFAASSLTEAFQDIAVLYRERNPGIDVEFNFAGSQVLRTQIEEGAHADVFASADTTQMGPLLRRGLAGDARLFVANRIVVVTPVKKPKVHRLSDLARPGTRIVIADANVPVGRYTIRVLERMAVPLGAEFQKKVTANVVSQETNVRGVLAKVALDEVDAGFIYATDAATSDKVMTLDIPDSLNVIAEYPMAVISASTASKAAERFMVLVGSADGRAILAKRGFRPVP